VKCPNCNHEWKLPGPQAGGRAKVKKGFAMGQPSAAARKRAWKTRKRISDLEDKLKHAERIGGFSFSPNPSVLLPPLGGGKEQRVVGRPSDLTKTKEIQ